MTHLALSRSKFSVAAAVTERFPDRCGGIFTVLFVGGVAMGIVIGFVFSSINAMLVGWVTDTVATSS